MSWLISYLSSSFMNSYPRLALSMLSLARRLSPFISFEDSLVVLRADDIKEVLKRSSDFEAGPVASAKMLLGPFLLGMDPWPAYDDMHSELDDILKNRENFARGIVRKNSRAAYENIKCQLDSGKPFDIVKEYALRVVSSTAQELMGVGQPKPSRVLAADDPFAAMFRTIGSIIASASPAPFGLQRVAEEVSQEFKSFLDETIDKRIGELATQSKTGARKTDTVLDLLIRNEEIIWNGGCRKQAIDNIRAKLGGLILAGSTAIVKAFAHSLYQLLSLDSWQEHGPRPLEQAIAAAAQDPDKVEQILYEALRFNPVFFFVVRYCPRATTLASRTSREIEISANTTVLLPLASGMFDDTSVARAENFTCPRESSAYLHFGYGQHRCIGERIAAIELVEMLVPLLKHPNFKHAKPMKVKYDGPAVHSFLIRLPKSR